MLSSFRVRRRLRSVAAFAFLVISANQDAAGTTVVRESAEVVLREAWSLALVEVTGSSRESYGFLWSRTCGYRTNVLVRESVIGPVGALTIVTNERLESGKQFLIATRRLPAAISTPTDPYLRCRFRHELHASRVAPLEDDGGRILVMDPRGDLLPPGRHPEAPDRKPVDWSEARSRIDEVLATRSSYPAPVKCPSGSEGVLRGGRGSGSDSPEDPYVVTRYATCEGIGWYSKEGLTAPWTFIGEDVPSFLR